jgi:hypothetical protein
MLNFGELGHHNISHNFGIQCTKSVGDSLEGPLKQPGESCLKPKKTKAKHISLKSTHGARPTLRWPPQPTKAAHSKVHSSGLRFGRGYTPPSSGLCLARGYMPPSSGLRLARGYTPPLSRLRLARGSSAHARPSPHAGTGI